MGAARDCDMTKCQALSVLRVGKVKTRPWIACLTLYSILYAAHNVQILQQKRDSCIRPMR